MIRSRSPLTALCSALAIVAAPVLAQDDPPRRKCASDDRYQAMLQATRSSGPHASSCAC